MKELFDPVFADIVGVLLRLGPRQRSAEREQAHRGFSSLRWWSSLVL